MFDLLCFCSKGFLLQLDDSVLLHDCFINNDRPDLGALPNTLYLFKFLSHQRFSLVKNNNRHL